MSVHNGHRERMRSQLVQNGLSGLAPHNALEVLLFYTVPRGDTNELAHRLIDTFGSFSAVLDAPMDALLSVKGVGQVTALFLKLLPQAAAYYAMDKTERRPILDSTTAAGRFFQPRFLGLTREELHMVSLDDRRQVIRCVKISDGIVNATPIMVKRIMAEVLATNCTSVILAHNHPSNFAIPSSGDISATRSIAQSLRQISVELTDHFVVCNDDFVSMRDSGMLTDF